MRIRLLPLNLQNLDAVITGLRAYDVHEWLAGKYDVLMDYVKKGGNLIVQYNRNRGNDSTGIGPYPFIITNARVTEEDAPVQFLLPENPVLHFPNQITGKDFEGWIQERGIYFAQHIDPRYQAVLSMHDSGEPDQMGSLITAKYGKGNFTYTGLVFFRELPAGVPGAYRLLANLIAQNQTLRKIKHAEKKGNCFYRCYRNRYSGRKAYQKSYNWDAHRFNTGNHCCHADG